jgi:hypothetical protein
MPFLKGNMVFQKVLLAEIMDLFSKFLKMKIDSGARAEAPLEKVPYPLISQRGPSRD